MRLLFRSLCRFATLLLGLGVGLCLVFATGCKPGPGSSCDPGEARCLDSKRELVCDQGKLVETPCHGKGGCSTVQETTTCDISLNQAGDPCSHGDEGSATCADEGTMLACHSGKFVRVACRGPKGCITDEGRPLCDQSIATPSDVCKLERAKACSVDKQAVLICREHQMQELYRCRGERGCNSEAGKLSCDQTVARPSDVCDRGLEGTFACSEDRAQVLTCKAERFTSDEKCKPGAKCVVEGTSTSCAKK